MKNALAILASLTLVATAHVASAQTPLFDGKTLTGWKQVKSNTWTVKDGAIASLGKGRGYIYSTKEWTFYRIFFTVRHIKGDPDHNAAALIFGNTASPQHDALGGIQFQLPNGGSWDYRPGHNNGGGSKFKKFAHPRFDPHKWSRVELLVDGRNGTAQMAVAQPPGSKAFPVMSFKDATAGRKGPIAFQMHNKGLFDEYKDIVVTENPKTPGLISTK